MSSFDLPRRLVAEALGTCALVYTVVGSGIMAERLTDDMAVCLLGNTIPTGAILAVLITVLGPVSRAHLNPNETAGFITAELIVAAAAVAVMGWLLKSKK